MDVTIFHNPQCSTSRKVLGLIRAAGIEPTIIEYLKTPPSRSVLKTMIAKAGLSVRDAMREKNELYTELGLDDPNRTNDELLDAMLAHPVLINRPFVISSRGTKLCRPVETVLEVLPDTRSAT